MQQPDPQVTELTRLMRRAYVERKALREKYPFKLPDVSRKDVIKALYDRLKAQYSPNLNAELALNDARGIEQRLHKAGLYADVIKLKEAISSECRKYVHSRNKRIDEHNRIRRSIQRLLLFIHAKECKDTVCKDPRYRQMCPQYKDLFNHTMSCKDDNCQVHHCTSSKYIIAHWSDCKDKKSCLTCGNVLEALRKQRAALGGSTSGAASQRSRSGLRRVRPTHDLTNVFTQTRFRQHFRALHEEANVFYTAELLEESFGPVLKELEKLEYGWVFATAVDTAALDLAHYKSVIDRPMDLGQIRERIRQGRYTSMPPSGVLRKDVASVFRNAMTFNKPKHLVYKVAEKYLGIFEEKFDAVCADLSLREAQQRMEPHNHCALCGGGKVFFEPLVLWCAECGNKIKRDHNFYVAPMAQNKQTCEPCYRRLHNKELKATMQKRVHDHTPDEQWIQCDCCNRWCHDICGLVNSIEVRKKDKDSAQQPASAPPKRGGGGSKAKRSKSSSSSPAGAAAAKNPTIIQETKVTWTCPLCIYRERCRLGAESPPIRREYRGAAFLPENRMTTEIERHLNSFLVEEMRKRQREVGPEYNSHTEFERVKVRCMSNIERHIAESTTKKNPMLFEWLREQNNYKLDFKGRSKMILLFQEKDGVDVIFFAMYVQEYDENVAHGPNRKTCYISYLDSVKYFRPAYLRTQLYYELLLSYFGWVKKRGFTRGYIWACPPNENNGNDYILYCHPKSQQTPTEERLRQWYRRMVVIGHERGLMVKCQNLAEAHLRDATDCTSLPYFSGDFWPQSAELTLKEMPKPPASTRKSVTSQRNRNQKSKGGSKATPTGMRRGTRSTETELVGALANQRPRDVLVKKLCQKISSPQLRDNFLVIDFFDTCSHCNKFIIHGTRKWSCTTCNAPIEKNWAAHTFRPRGSGKSGPGGSKCGKDKGKTGRRDKANQSKKASSTPAKASNRAPRLVRTTSSGRATRDPRPKNELEVPSADKDIGGTHRKKERPEKFVLCDACHTQHMALPVAEQHPATDPVCAHELTEEQLPKVLPSTVEVDEELSSEIFNEREELLTLCQTNHYQFDQVRRAKHSTMMFLYHTFNPESMRDALPATCDECGSNIQGAQYRCKTCPDYDMCMNCFKRRVPHIVNGKKHELKLHDPAREPNVFVERREAQQRAQNRQRLNEVLVHATTCPLGVKWPNPCKYGKSCYKVGTLLRHWQTCKVPEAQRRQCQHCVIMWPILQQHFKVCQNKACPVPSCTAHQPLYQSARGPTRGMSRPTPSRPAISSSSSSSAAAKENNSSGHHATPVSSITGSSVGKGGGKSSGTTLVLSNKPKKRKQPTSGQGKAKITKSGMSV
eukprot:INCI17911.2.p1 GENE.INCI17911.2~~INCI17911.2.p1  ORF type:complete len:1445 (-),score=206.00 INCI17911.2:235-4284(-)